MKISPHAFLVGIAATAAIATTAQGDTSYYNGYPDRPAVIYTPAPPGYYAPAPQYRYVPPGLSITTALGTYAPFYGGWNPYGHDNVGGYDHYRSTPDR